MRAPAGAATVGRRHFGDELARRLAHALGGAGLEGRGEVVRCAPVRVQRVVRGLGRGFAVDHVVHDVVRARHTGVGGVGEHAVLDRVARFRRLAGAEAAAPQHEVAVVVVGLHVGAEAAGAQGQILAGLELHLDQAAFAVAGLLEQCGAEQAGHLHAGEVGVALRQCRIGRDGGEAAGDLLRFAAQVTLLLEHLHQHAEGAVVILVVEQAGQLRIGGVGQARMDAADAEVGGELLGEVERLARDDVDVAGGAAVLQASLGRLVDFHATDQFRRQQGVAHAASHGAALAQHEPVGGAHSVAVDQGLGEAGAGAAQTDAIGFVEATFVGTGRADVDAGQALQRIGHVVRRQLADILGGNHLDVGDGVALDVECLFHRAADARDSHRRKGLHFLLVRSVGVAGVALACRVALRLRAVLRICAHGQAQTGNDAGGEQCLAVVHGVPPLRGWLGSGPACWRSWLVLVGRVDVVCCSGLGAVATIRAHLMVLAPCRVLRPGTSLRRQSHRAGRVRSNEPEPVATRRASRPC